MNDSDSQAFDILEPQLKAEWEAQYRAIGLDWEEIREAYHFGWDAAQRPEFTWLDWTDVEQDLARHWYLPEEATELNSWDYVKEAVRAGWERSRQALQPFSE